MLLFKNKISFTFSLLLLSGVLLFASYCFYYTYQSYKMEKERETLSILLDKTEDFLDALGKERVNTVVYAAKPTQDHLKTLELSHLDTDAFYNKLDTFLMASEAYIDYRPSFLEINTALNKIRTALKSQQKFELNGLTQLFHYEIYESIKNILQRLFLAEKSVKKKNNLLVYRAYNDLKENAVMENTVVVYALESALPMSAETLAVWKTLIENDHLPNLHILADSSLVLQMNELLPAKKYAAYLSREREMIFAEHHKGNYSVTAQVWLNKMNEKLTELTTLQSLLSANIYTIEETTIEKHFYYLLAVGAVWLFLFYLLAKFLYLYMKRQNNSQISDETLKEIALVFNEHQQLTLNRLINEGKADHIYRFLIRAIKDANQTKDLFLASMSHEIRTPLNGILGFTQLLKKSREPNEQQEYIAIIEKSSANLLSIVNDILDLSKIKAQKIELEEITFDPLESFESIVESYAAKAAEEQIDFNIFLDPSLPTQLLGDPTKISQVIVNLVSNAIKFTSKNGEVNVRIEKILESTENVKVKFSVLDTGIGISAEQQKKIFDAFSQADISTSRKYGGTGLGLSISGKIVALMGSELKIKSTKDEGSEFFFTLNFKKASDEVRIVEDLSALSVGILDPHIRYYYYKNENLAAYIHYTGASVKHYTEKSLLSVLEFKGELPDILFIDHKFRQRGEELKQFLDIDTKIVLMTTRDQKRNIFQYRSQIDRVLYKPVTFYKTLKILTNQEEERETRNDLFFHDLHILVAEDNEINQKLIKSVLEGIGIEVSLVNNGAEALEMRMAQTYDMIFMDIEMPVMGGMEATGKILSYEKNNSVHHIPIVALTANALTGDRSMYLAAGMDGYLSKPIELEALYVLLKSYFEEKIEKESEI